MILARTGSVVFASCLWACATGSAHAQAKIEAFGDLPGGLPFVTVTAVSADGTVIVGFSESANGREAFRWTAQTGIVALGDLRGGAFDSGILAASGDGSTLVGWGTTDIDFISVVWTQGGGLQSIHDSAYATSFASGVSSDGSVVAGTVGNNLGVNHAYRWTHSTGLEYIGDLWESNPWSLARSVSGDGNFIVGVSMSPGGPEAFRWNAESGMVGLGWLPSNNTNSDAFAASETGEVIVGSGGTPCGIGLEALNWTGDEGPVGLGDLPGELMASRVNAVSANGSVMVGFGMFMDKFNKNGGITAVVWTPQRGPVPVIDLLIEQGVDMEGWNLEEAMGVSADGTVIVGNGSDNNGRDVGWRATLVTNDPSYCRADCTRDGALDIDDFICFQTAFAIGLHYANCDRVCDTLDIDDFICFQTAFAEGCP